MLLRWFLIALSAIRFLVLSRCPEALDKKLENSEHIPIFQ